MSTVIRPETFVKMAQTVFMKEARAGTESNLVQPLCEIVNSSYLTEDYVYVGHAPQMQLVQDEMRFEDLTDATYSLTSAIHKIGIRVPRADMTDQRFRHHMKRIEGVTRVARRYPNKLIVNQMEAGTVDLSMDGSPVFSNSRTPRGKAVSFDNLYAGTGEQVAQVQADLNGVITLLGSMIADNGEPLHEALGTIVLVVPWRLRKVFRTVLGAQIIANTSNVEFSDLDIKVITSTRLTDSNDWYAFHVGGHQKPMIYQEYNKLTFEPLLSGPTWTIDDVAIFTVRWGGATGWTDPRLSVKVVVPQS